VISQQDFQRQLDALNAEFKASLPERVALIEQQWARLSERLLRARAMKAAPRRRGRALRAEKPAASPQNEMAALERELHRALHSLAGSAQVVGFGTLGEAARRAELALGGKGARSALRRLSIMQQALKTLREQLELELQPLEVSPDAHAVVHH
jgi:HPt (histidine-containing phosphotransfer) domain-containing protein